uniref:NADH-ubiquinone oxidoreductase chain 3 n=1 Tax=Lucifotychus sp. 1 EF-2015 TaxID=1756870 RepID=A0A0S2M7J5_9COLE|nr:NADH deshydrogenase subunit 3 [Lucifotychus sp. 1 EF-2015]
MLYLTLMTFIIMILSFSIMILVSMISKKTFNDREKNSPFECGFDPKSSARLPFSLHFFLMGVIFLIFDIEISLLIPLIFTMKYTNLMNFLMISFFFFSILIIGLYYEWHQGALNWLF